MHRSVGVMYRDTFLVVDGEDRSLLSSFDPAAVWMLNFSMLFKREEERRRREEKRKKG